MGKLRFIDLSVPIEAVPSEFVVPEIEHEDHVKGANLMKWVFGAEDSDLPDGLGWANDTLKLQTHTGTHLDAPWHYFPTAEGKKAKTIDEVPLEWCFSDGVVLDMRHKPDGSVITVDDVREALGKINYEIKPFDIVLIMTGVDKYWGTPEYLNKGSGMGRESTIWLCDQCVKIMGIDSWGFDRPFVSIKEEFEKTRNKKILWEAHFAGMEREYCHIEKLANLDKIPKPFGFKVACFPVKITGASAGWCRPVAIIEE